MKTILLALVLLANPAFAQAGPIETVVNSAEFSQFVAEQSKVGFQLLSVSDNYLAQGVSPNCPCSSVQITLKDPKENSTRVCTATAFLKKVTIKDDSCMTTQHVQQTPPSNM